MIIYSSIKTSKIRTHLNLDYTQVGRFALFPQWVQVVTQNGYLGMKEHNTNLIRAL